MTTQIWPPVIDPATGSIPGSGWVGTRRVLAIPAVGRALSLTAGMISTMPLNAVRGMEILSRPGLLEVPQPEPGRDRSWWVHGQVSDYWLHGNSVHLVTSRLASGLPGSVMWLPAERVGVVPAAPSSPEVLEYRFDGVLLPSNDVVHVRRGADPMAPWRGVGVIEQHMSAFARVADQEAYESGVLRGSAVPSIVVVTPNETSQEETDKAKKRWVEKFEGPKRGPVFVPPGTEVKPLSWSPKDQQLNEARQLSLVDVANIANMDAFWLGGQSTGLDYKSAGPMFLTLMRQTLEPIVSQLEGAWGQAWLPHGQQLRFDRQAILGDDMGTTIGWLRLALSAGLVTMDEARAYIGKSPRPEGELKPIAVTAIPAEEA